MTLHTRTTARAGSKCCHYCGRIYSNRQFSCPCRQHAGLAGAVEQYRQMLAEAPAMPELAEPPAVPVGTRVIIHRNISPRAVFGTVIGGHGALLSVRTAGGAIWAVRRDRVTVIRRVDAWDVLRRCENIFNFRAMDLKDAQFDALHNRAVCIAARINARMGV